MICFGLVATKTQITPEQYLHMTFEHDAEFVFAGQKPLQSFPDTPPLVVIENLSKDDRHTDFMRKLEEYRTRDAPSIWIVDPAIKPFSVYTELGLQNVSSFNLAEYPFQLTQPELFADL